MAPKMHISCLCLALFVCCSFHLPLGADAATEYNRYLAHIFQKYGNGGTMSFEGLEHLMYSLGLGQIEFEPKHTIAEHWPNGINRDDATNDNDPELRTYFEQEIIKLIPKATTEAEADSAELKMKHGVLQVTSGGTGTKTKITEDILTLEDSDVSTRDRSIRRDGILLEFKEMHDPKHRHPRENDATFDGPTLNSNVCLSPKSLLRLVVDHDDLHKRKLYKIITNSFKPTQEVHNSDEEYNEFVNNVKLTPVAFMKLCPALLAQIDQHVCMRPAPLLNGSDPKEALWNAWIYASCSIFILSACGLLGILLVPLMKSVAYQEILKFLVAVAVGTLSGDALMHLLPHALVAEHGEHVTEIATSHESAEAGKHAHDNTAVWICACAFGTAVFMYILENLLPLLKSDSEGGAHGHSHAGHGHGHGHVHVQSAASSADMGQVVAVAMPEPPTADVKDVKEINIMLNETKKDKKSPSRPLTPVAFMVVIGDGLHNLTDGLAIGAAFATDPVTGMATAFAVLCHELPHELGDFALLLQTGVSMKRAVMLNLVSSVLSFVGMAVGLLIAGIHTNMTQWIYAGTAGSFLYIAFADLIPAMGGEGKRDFKSALIQILGIIVGGVIMLVIAVNEDDLEVLFK